MFDAGYDGEPDEAEEGGVTFALVHAEAFYSDMTVARLLRNGHPVGIFRLESETEFEWLKKRVDGTFEEEG